MIHQLLLENQAFVQLEETLSMFLGRNQRMMVVPGLRDIGLRREKLALKSGSVSTNIFTPQPNSILPISLKADPMSLESLLKMTLDAVFHQPTHNRLLQRILKSLSHQRLCHHLRILLQLKKRMASLNASLLELPSQVLHGTRVPVSCSIVESMKFLKLEPATSLLSRVSLERMKILTPAELPTLAVQNLQRQSSRSSSHQG